MRSPRLLRGLAALLAVLGLLLPLIAAAPPRAYDGEPSLVANPVDYVDTLVGTGTGGEIVGEINNFPGAAVPFGMVQYSPDTTDNYAGYDYQNPRSTGFSMTHASVGCAAFGDISVLPTTTAISVQPWRGAERIAHDDSEVGVPGYYSVHFPATGVTAELTATTRTGFGRFSYPRDGRPALLRVQSGASLAGNSRSTIQLGADNTTITGWATSGGFCGKNNTYTVYFAMKFNQPFISYGAWDGYAVYAGVRGAHSRRSGAYVEFPSGAALEVQTAISYVGIDGARANLAAEGAASFDDVRTAAAREWNAALLRIAVAGRDPDELVTFYSCLYRSLLHPNTFNDADGRYLGFDGAIHTVPQGHTQYANFSDWDTYRSLAALQGLLFPSQASDMAQSLVNDAEQSGAFPRWPLANSSTGMMTGDNAVPLIVNLYTFGAKDFDVHTALRYMVNAATRGGVGLNGYVERPGITTYQELGFGPQVSEFATGGRIAGASITLEWAIDDFTISRFAQALGDDKTAAEFQHRSQYWQNLFNPSTGFISPRDRMGFFPDGPGFTEIPEGFGQDGFDEGNAEQYLWMVPQNIAGLVTALGGRAAAENRLDRFTKKLNVGPNQPYLWAGNEPGFGVPWIYNYLGAPWKTQRTVNRVRGLFAATPDGAPGNDDLGALSSWYVWAALGLYPITAGTPILTVNTPLFDRAVISLPADKFIQLSAPGASAPSHMRYISGLRINGAATDQTYLPESIITTGGDVAFELAAVPNKQWGSGPSSAPPSFGAGGSAVTVNVPRPIIRIAPGTTRTVRVDLQRMITGIDEFTITGESSTGGITVVPTSGRFAENGSATTRVGITVDKSVDNEYYLTYLTTTAGATSRTSTVLVVVLGYDE